MNGVWSSPPLTNIGEGGFCRMRLPSSNFNRRPLGVCRGDAVIGMLLNCF